MERLWKKLIMREVNKLYRSENALIKATAVNSNCIIADCLIQDDVYNTIAAESQLIESSKLIRIL